MNKMRSSETIVDYDKTYELINLNIEENFALKKSKVHLKEVVDYFNDDEKLNKDLLLGQIYSHNKFNPDVYDYITFITSEYDYFKISSFLELARAKNKKFLLFNKLKAHNFEGIRIDSLFIFISSDEMKINDLLMFQNHFSDKKIGILPFENLNQVIDYYENYSHLRNKNLIIDRVSKNKKVYKDCEADNVFYLFKEEAIYNLIYPFFEKLNIFNYISHSRECALLFTDFIFCNADNIRNNEITDNKSCFPACHYYESNCFQNKRTKINLKLLNANYAFLNGCNLGDLDNSVIPIEYGIAYNLFRNGVSSVIASTGIKNGDISENILFHNLLRYGYEIGEIVIYLNEYLKSSKIDSNRYYLLGEPGRREVIVSKFYNHNYDYEIQKNQLEVKIELKHDCSYLEIEIPENYKEWFLNSVELNKKSKDDDIYYFFYKKPNKTKLILFSLSKFKFNKVSIILSRVDSGFILIEEIKEKIENFEFYANYFHLDNKIKGMIVDISNNSKTIFNLYKTCFYSINDFQKLRHLVDGILNKFIKINTLIFSSIEDYTFQKKNNYLEEIMNYGIINNSIASKEKCIHCSSEVSNVYYSLISNKNNCNRFYYKCYSCGNIFDRSSLNVLVNLNPNLSISKKDNEINILTLKNTCEDNIHLKISLIPLENIRMELTESKKEIELKRDEVFTFKVKFDVDENAIYNYYLFAIYIMVNGKFCFISTTINYVDLDVKKKIILEG